MVAPTLAAGGHALTASFGGQLSAPFALTVHGGNATYWFSSGGGDYIGGGATASYFTPTDEIDASSNGNYVRVVVTAFGVPLGTPWTIILAAPTGQILSQGSYPNATSFFPGNAGPGMSVGGDGLGCNNYFGSFVISQFQRDPVGNVTLLDASFVQHCENAATPALMGTIHFTPSPPVPPGPPDPPDPPTDVTAAPTGPQGWATVSWWPGHDNGYGTYRFTVTASPGGQTATAGPFPGALAALSMAGLAEGVPYTFTVRATNALGDSAESAPSAPLMLGDPPDAPPQVFATAEDRAASVSWKAPNDNGIRITSYAVTVSPGGTTKIVAPPHTATTITGLSNGVAYTFTVHATNAVDNGPESPRSNAVVPHSPSPPPPRSGYWMLGADGAVYAFGSAHNDGSASYAAWTNGPHAVALDRRRDGSGYWVVDNIGDVHAFGHARFFGDRPALLSGEQISTMSATPSGGGYWLFSNRGRAFAYGDAHFYGDMSATVLNGPIVASVATPTGHGYYMVGSDGGVFSSGDAHFHGSTGNLRLNKSVVGISPTPDNQGYWLVASDGGVFAFTALFRGSMGATHLNKPVNGLVAYGTGYLMVASDGGIFDFSNKAFVGSLANNPPAAPIIGLAAFAT